ARRAHKILSTSGTHAYEAPGAGDQRGPCPGLNALANNGYINRNGITSPTQVITASKTIGIADDVSAVLAALCVIAGNGVTCSIGNSSGLGGYGLNKHNFFEGDTSYKSCDCKLCPTHPGCDNYHFNNKAWTTTYNAAQLNGGLFGIPTFKISAKQRYDECVANNTRCVFGPAQFIFHYGTPCLFAYIFPGDAGVASEAIENTWIGISYSGGQRVGKTGGGQIPDNWVPLQSPYTVPELAECILDLYTANPVALGANVGAGFVLSPSEQQLPSNPDVNDILCFIYAAIFSSAPTASLLAVARYLDPIFTVSPWFCPIFSTGR
ncbi:unnamed protein product, partial [Didymodactylos carnosus]